MSSEESPPPIEELAEAGRYPKFSAAQERGLVAAALDVPYWVIREGREFVLYVAPPALPYVADELMKFEEEYAERRAQQEIAEPTMAKFETLPLFLGAWIMSTFWAVQNYVPESWISWGDAENGPILAGAWWRTITALTLHGDLSHFVANLCFGLLFVGFLLPRLGGGVTWLGFVLAGAIGNGLNAWFYRGEMHRTIGASTAVFGALGMLVACEFLARWRRPEKRGWWHLVVPLGGGLALLAYLGVGDEAQHHIDYMAHFWGFAAGLLLGALAPWRPASGVVQTAAGGIAVVLPPIAWSFALLG